MGCIFAVLWGSGFFLENPITIKEELVIYEYGQMPSNSMSDYFEIIDESRLQEVTFNSELPTDGVVPVGNYEIVAKWKNPVNHVAMVNAHEIEAVAIDVVENSSAWKSEQLKVTVMVRDTIAPQITLKEEMVKINWGEKYDAASNIDSVIDPIDGELGYSIEGEIDVKTSGEQTLKVVSTDVNGNVAEASFIVVVGEKPKTGERIKVNNATYPMVHQDATCKITIYKEWYENAWVYAAHVQFSDYDRLKTAVANGNYGSTETTYHAANRLGAILAVNGDYSAKYLDYPVARNGKVWNDKACWVPAIYNQNNGKLLSAWETGGTSGIAGVSLSALVAEGKVTDTFSFGPPFLSNGVVSGSTSGRAQRTFIGTNGNAGDIWIVVSEGRYTDGVSAGLTHRQCAQFLKEKGCTFGIPLDGGGSSTMIFKGKVLTATSQRAVVDFLYFK